jgi:hypothetical protein
VCVNCLTTAEAVVLQSAGVVAAMSVGRDRLRALSSPRAWKVRREQVRRHDEAFVRSLGLDPEAVLGPTRSAALTRR